ncbi:MAG TPA: chromosome segregation protein SMC [Vicinamibacteria bacterium]|jgi:chromosome segregation protein
MRLDRVDINGFKSFGERTELSFHEGVTAIVGPNGCGKSNISDAIGWALGEQSAKSLRGQKMEDLIFNGSERRAPVSFAEVNLRLSNINGSPDGGLREAVVTRRLYRSGESEYLLDGKPCRLRDIVELFMDTGMGNKAYSIMEQGKIGLILSSKPSDRRGVIEEAAGITKYKARRRSAELKLQAAQQNLLRVNDIVYEVERQMSSLKRQAGKARRYKRLRSSITHLEKIAGVQRSGEIEVELERFRRELKVFTDEELRRSTSLVTAETYLERLRLEQAEKESGLEDTRGQLHRLEIAIERLDHQTTRDRQQLKDFDNRQSQLERDLRELEKRLEPASRQLELRQGEAAQAVEDLSALEGHAARSREELARASVSLAEIERQIEENRAELLNRISKIATLNNFLQGVLANAEKVSSESLKLQEERRELEAERGRLANDRQALQQEQSDRRAEATRLAATRETMERELAELRVERAQVERDVFRRREEASSLSGRLASLEELVSARAHFGAGARALLTAGTELGVRLGGVIADAMEVQPDFERAAERFYGESLQRILVENEEDALAAHRWLEEENAGRCDFVIESLAGQTKASEVWETLDVLRQQEAKGVVGLLSEAVRWSNGKSELFARLLPDAVVVEDVESALAAFHLQPGVPYVTMQGGAVLAPPGILRAGPGGPSEGLLTSRREIRELRETLSQNARELERQDARQQEIQTELARREAALADVSQEQHSLEKVLVGLDHRLRQLDGEWAQTERKAQVLASEQARADSERSALGVKRAEMEATLSSEQEAKSRVDAELEEARASLSDRRASVELFQGKAAEEASKVAALRERVQAVRIDVDRLQEGVNELRARVEAGRKEQHDLVGRQSDVKESLVAAEAELNQSLAQRDELRETLVRLEGATGRLRERIGATEEALKLRRKELESTREKRSQQEILLAREESEMNHLRQGFWEAHEISISDAAALLSPSDLARDEEDLAGELSELKSKLDAIGPVNPMADEEFQELETRHEFLVTQRQDLLDSVASTEKAIQRIDTTSRQRFLEALEAINVHFQATFKQLFGGGRAGIRLIDEQDVLESGIDIIAQPPGKKLQNVLLLSGGEKAMTAIAIMFAIFRYKPSPFCLLDEVDAPLDEANVGRFLMMLSELRQTTQFVVITHNVKTMEHADQMYGVTMEEPGISKLVSVRLEEGSPVAAASRS